MTPNFPSPVCPECGASLSSVEGCFDHFGLLLSWEADDPELLKVHFLTVACYNLQHPARFTEQVRSGLREALKAHLETGLPVSEIRKRHARIYGGPTRVLKTAPDPPELRDWSMTVHDVVQSGPGGAADRVRLWAESVNREI